MKKTILLSFAVGLTMGVSAQTNNLPEMMLLPKTNFMAEIDPHQSVATGPVKVPNYTTRGGTAALNKTLMGSSYNAYTLLVSESSCLTANESLNMVMFTHRQCASYAGGSAKIQSSFSTDGGSVWDSSLVITAGISPNLHRYPSGVIYNPIPNTNPLNAYSVIAGPITDGAGWQGNFFASAKVDGSNIDEVNLINGDPGVTFQHMARIGMTSTDNGKVHVLGVDFDYNNSAAAEFYGAILNTGTFNAVSNTFDWTTTKVDHAFAHDPVDNSKLIYHLGNMTWSKDGLTGYVMFLGRDSVADQKAPQPIVYKSIDAGLSWNLLPVYDFANLPLFQSMIQPTSGGNIKPYFSAAQGLDLTVDVNGDLHIASIVYGSSSDHPDSLGYIWTTPMQIFDVYTTSTGWNALFVDTIYATSVTVAQDAQWSLGWDARIQISRTSIGNKIFYSWLDTDPTIDLANIAPDIKAKGFDITNGKVTPSKNFTAGTAYDGDNFWLYMAENTFTSGTTYKLNLSTSFGSMTDLDPFYHYFFSGAEFDETEFVLTGIDETFANNFSVSQNYPNPFTSGTAFNVTLSKNANVNVTVYNLIGQNVTTIQKNNLTSGTHSITIERNNLDSGVYFYAVEVDGEIITKKMILK